MTPPTNCPHCFAARPPRHHYTDAGALDPVAALDAGYCPELARLRNLNTAPAAAA